MTGDDSGDGSGTGGHKVKSDAVTQRDTIAAELAKELGFYIQREEKILLLPNGHGVSGEATSAEMELWGELVDARTRLAEREAKIRTAIDYIDAGYPLMAYDTLAAALADPAPRKEQSNG